MAKFIYITDIHARLRAPAGRSDPDFLETVDQKLWSILSWGMQNGVDAVLCGGDITDHPLPGYRVLAMLAKLIHYSEIPWYVCLGQHDVFGYNVEQHETIAARLLETTMPKHFHILPDGWAGEVLDDFGVRIAGLHVRSDGPDKLPEALKSLAGKADIVIAHVMVTPKSAIYHHIALADVPAAVPLLLLGDYHPGFYWRGQMENGQPATILNPGALLRMSRSPSDMEREPRFVVIDTDHLDQPQFMRPAFRTDIWQADPDTTALEKQRLQQFVTELSTLSTTAPSYQGVEELLRVAAKMVDARQEVVDYALQLTRKCLQEAGRE